MMSSFLKSRNEAQAFIAELEKGLPPDVQAKLRTAISACLEFIVQAQIKRGAENIIGRRAIAAAWVVKPDLFAGKSQSEIARELGCHKMLLSRPAAEFSRAFGITNRGQSHGWNSRSRMQAASKMDACPLEETEQHEDN